MFISMIITIIITICIYVYTYTHSESHYYYYYLASTSAVVYSVGCVSLWYLRNPKSHPHPRLQDFPRWKKTHKKTHRTTHTKQHRITKNSLAAGIRGLGKVLVCRYLTPSLGGARRTNMCVYIYIYTHTYIYTYIHIYIYRYMHTCIYIYIYIYTHAYTDTYCSMLYNIMLYYTMSYYICELTRMLLARSPKSSTVQCSIV